MMTTLEILLVQDSFRQIARSAPQVAALFYARLFELDPRQQEYFSAQPHERGANLMVAMAVAISSLEAAALTTASARRSGSAQATATNAGTALFWTLQKCLGPDFTPAVSEAWAQTYSLVGDTLTATLWNLRDDRV